MEELITTFSKQVIKQKIFENLLGLNEREKRKIINSHPLSLHELRIKVKQQLVEKSIMKVLSNNLKSLSAGKMGYTTSEVGDLVVKYIQE